MRLSVLLIPLVAAAGLALLAVPRGSTATAPRLSGTILPARPAPAFNLTDQFGRRITLSEFRGEPVVLTFLAAHCTQQCPLVAEKIRSATAQIDRAGGHVAVLAITMDPEGDTRAAVRTFSRQHGMLNRWHFLTGSRKELVPVWHAYYVYAAPKSAPPKVRDGHTGATYLLDKAGRERVLIGGDPDLATLTHDLRILAGLPPDPHEASEPAPEIGHPAPDFSLHTPTGGTLHLANLRGKVVVLNFWATYCPPCRSEMPELQSWYRRHRAAGLVMVGVNEREDTGAVRDFTRSLRIWYPIALDQSGIAGSRYDLHVQPTTVIIDRRGMVRSQWFGAIDQAYLQKSVAPLLAEGRS